MLDYKYLRELVPSAHKGDSNAFAELYAATYQQQYRYAFRYLQDEGLAADALQETFIRALRNIRKLQNPDLFIAWLSRINFRVCSDILWTAEDDDTVIDDEECPKMQHPVHDMIENEVLKIDQREYLLRQVMNLPLTESQVILMKYYQGMNLNEIADVMNIGRGTAKRYIRNGRVHLRKMLTESR